MSRRSDSRAAVGLAAATVVNNAFGLLFTVVFTRLLGASGYAALAALIAAFLILIVAAQAMQAAASRDVALDRLGSPDALGATLRAWTARLLAAIGVVTAASVLLREPLAALIGVPEVPWAAAAVPPTGALWMLLSLQRGALQGLGAYGAVGASIVLEAVGRLTCALVLYAAGLGVTGALLGTPLAVLIVAAALEVALRRRLGAPPGGAVPVRSLRSLARQGWLPIAGLLLLAVLQNVDVIVAKHELPADVAGSYAAAAMAAKSIVWVGMGIALFVLPEAARRAAARLDPRPVLLRALAILVAAAVPAVAVFAAAPELIVRLAFGDDLTSAASALPLLGGAMAMLAVAYLAVQLSIAVDAKRFLWVLAAGAVAEVLLLQAGDLGPVSFAAIVLGVQCTVAAGVLALALRAGRG